MPVSTRSKKSDEEREIEPEANGDKMAEETEEPTIKDLFMAFKKGNADTQKKLENIELSIATNQKTLQDYIVNNDDMVRKAEASYKKISGKLERAEKQIEEDRRKANIIIDGLKENKDVHPSVQVTAVLEEIGVKLKPECILTASRLGAVTAGKSRRPRNILVKFVSPFWKQEIFRNIHKSKDSENWNGVHIQDDLPQELIEQRRELRCLAAFRDTMPSSQRCIGAK